MDNNKNILLSGVTTTRKCGGCGEIIILEEELFKEDVVIAYQAKQKKSYHKDCFFETMMSKKKPPENIPELWSEMLENTEYLKGLVFKNHLYYYFARKFEITLFTSSFYQKMEQVYNGKWKNVSKPVRPEHLLDMFIQKELYLDKQLAWKKLTGVEALNYSIAIIVNKYENYLSWLEKREIDNREVSEKMIVEIPNINILVKSTNNIGVEEDIFSDIDE